MKTLEKALFFLVFAGLFVACNKDEAFIGEAPEIGLKSSAAGMVFVVHPSGGDDTPAIMQAFDDAKAAGPGSTVKLVMGEYQINFIEVREFYGKFMGAGKGKTVINIIDDINIWDLINQNLNHVLIRFVGGDVCVSHMTIKGSNVPMDALIGISSVTATYTAENEFINAVIDNVEFAGNPENGYQRHGLKAESGFWNYPKPLSNINIEITNCSFNGFNWYGALIMELKEGSVKVGAKNKGNAFANNRYADLGLWHNTSLLASVEGNTFIGKGVDHCAIELASAPYPGYVEQVPQTFRSVATIEHNNFHLEGCWGGILINDNRRSFYPEELPMLVQVKSNQINTNEATLVSLRTVNLYGATIRNNRFTGGGLAGVNMTRWPGVYNENGLLLGNNFANSDYSLATVILRPGSRNWTIVGGNLGGSIIDEGENNIITGFNNQSPGSSPGQNISDNLREMRGGINAMVE